MLRLKLNLLKTKEYIYTSIILLQYLATVCACISGRFEYIDTLMEAKKSSV